MSVLSCLGSRRAIGGQSNRRDARSLELTPKTRQRQLLHGFDWCEKILRARAVESLPANLFCPGHCCRREHLFRWRNRSRPKGCETDLLLSTGGTPKDFITSLQ